MLKRQISHERTVSYDKKSQKTVKSRDGQSSYQLQVPSVMNDLAPSEGLAESL